MRTFGHNQQRQQLRIIMNKLQQFIAGKPGGYLKDTDILQLIALDRLCPVLVRCGGCRFTCAAQDVAHLESCIAAGGDYIRDVSFPTGSNERAAKWMPDCPVTPLAMVPASFTEPRKPKIACAHNSMVTTGDIMNAWKCADCGYIYGQSFDESQCGGVFDGSQVTSDADLGL